MPKTRALQAPKPESGEGVGRRRVVQGLLTGVGAGFAIPGLAATHPFAEHAGSPHRIAGAQAKAAASDASAELLSGYQMQVLESLSERIVPGAAAAGCARFIDSLLAVGGREAAVGFMSALGAIDAEARERFGSPWTGLDETQQVELLEAASTAASGRPERPPWTPGTSVAEHLASQRQAAPRQTTLRDHFDTIKGWVVGAYYSSEPGLWDLGYTGLSFGATFKPCSHPGGHRQS